MRILFVLPGEPFPRDYNMISTLEGAGHQSEIIYWARDYDRQLLRLCAKVSPFTSGGTELRKLFLMPAWMLFVSMKMAFSDFDLVQARNLPGLLAVLPMAGIRKSKIIYDLADFTSDSSELVSELPRLVSLLLGKFENYLVQMTDALLVVSEGQLAQQVRWPKGRPCSVVYNTPESTAKADSRANSDRLKVFFAGGLSNQRVPGILAVAQAVRRLPNASLLIAGSGNSREIAELASNSTQIEYIGFIPHAEVIKLTSSCDCVVAPYDPSVINNVVGMPNKLFEAMSSGKPILVSRGTLAGAIVEKYRCGIAVRYADVDDAERALRVLTDTEVRRTFGANGKRIFAERYSWSVGSGAYLRLCENLMR